MLKFCNAKVSPSARTRRKLSNLADSQNYVVSVKMLKFSRVRGEFRIECRTTMRHTEPKERKLSMIVCFDVVERGGTDRVRREISKMSTHRFAAFDKKLGFESETRHDAFLSNSRRWVCAIAVHKQSF